MRVAILTASDSGARGEREDLSAGVIRELIATVGGEVVDYRLVPDEEDMIAIQLIQLIAEKHPDVILTTGGTGLGPRDRTPEATRRVLDREAPGIAEAIRRATAARSPRAILSRAVAGLRGRTLIINLPGSPRGVRECLETVVQLLPHAVDMMAGGGHPEGHVHQG